ncbi:MAG: DUF4252 domain-containing protein [Bacteroidetes Order II. Incertae sedis bacterium]|nr:DUF4252 domain-containing protein [Bacteroidetes Order II. bacterium]
MKIFKNRLVHLVVWLIPLLVFGSTTHAQPIDFDALDRFFDEEPKIEVTLKGALLRMGARAAEAEDPEAAAMMRDIRGIYVRGYPVKGRSMEDIGRKMTGISRNLKGEGWDVVTRVRDEESNVYVMVKEGRNDDVLGMLVMVLDMDDKEPMAMFVHIDGKVDPDKIGRLTGNLNINGMEYFSSSGRRSHNRSPYVRNVCPDDDEDCIEAPKVPKMKEHCEEDEEGCVQMPRLPKFKETCKDDEEDCIETPKPIRFKVSCGDDEEDCVPMPVAAPKPPSGVMPPKAPMPPDSACPAPGKPGYKACMKAKREVDRSPLNDKKPKDRGQNMNFNDNDWDHPAVQKALRYAGMALNIEDGFDKLLHLAGSPLSNMAQAPSLTNLPYLQYSDVLSEVLVPQVRLNTRPDVQVLEGLNGNVKVRVVYDKKDRTITIDQ